jgi:heparosan-N-sulfate-glucuronate 5-epimerase
MLKVLIPILAVFVALCAPPAAFADLGEYLETADEPPILSGGSAIGHAVMGPEGVPQVNYYRLGLQDNPITVSQWGLQHFSWWMRHGDPADLEQAVTAASWLVNRQREDGAWEYLFAFNAYGARLDPPWISAMAQGQAMSLLVRVHEATGEAGYLDTATRALEPFTKSFDEGGVVSDWDGLPWYEEYPAEAPHHVLNGYEFALIGLRDVADLSPLADELWLTGVASLIARIHMFDVPTRRTQFYGGVLGSRTPVYADYRRVHALATRALADMTMDPTLRGWAERWEAYEVPLPSTRVTPQRPLVPSVAAPAPVVVRRVPRCLLADVEIRRSGLACRRARNVLRFYVRRRAAPLGWRCRTARRIVCRRGSRRASVGRVVRVRLAQRKVP